MEIEGLSAAARADNVRKMGFGGCHIGFALDSIRAERIHVSRQDGALAANGHQERAILLKAQVAQLVEHVTENHGVAGSIPALGTIPNM